MDQLLCDAGREPATIGGLSQQVGEEDWLSSRQRLAPPRRKRADELTAKRTLCPNPAAIVSRQRTCIGYDSHAKAWSPVAFFPCCRPVFWSKTRVWRRARGNRKRIGSVYRSSVRC